MAKKKRRAHYCKICGEMKSNESFTGKGHAAHICKVCAALPIERKNELQRTSRVESLMEKYHLTKEEWNLLEKYAKSEKYPELKEFARDVLELHRQRQEDRKPQIEEIFYSDLEEELKEEIDEHFYEDLLFFIEEKDFVPRKKHLDKITKGVCTAYLQHFHLRVIPDEAWELRTKQIFETVMAELKNNGVIIQSYENSLLVLETERLFISRFKEDDLNPLSKIMAKPEVMYAWEHGFTRTQTRKWLNRQLTRYRKDGYGYFAVYLKESGKLIGQAGLMKSSIEDQEVTELGFIFDNQFWGKGYATEAAKACIKYGFETLKLSRIYCCIRPENTASIRIAENIGMIKIGEYINVYNDADMLHYICIGKQCNIGSL